jgi:hypothetical protein
MHDSGARTGACTHAPDLSSAIKPLCSSLHPLDPSTTGTSMEPVTANVNGHGSLTAHLTGHLTGHVTGQMR